MAKELTHAELQAEYKADLQREYERIVLEDQKRRELIDELVGALRIMYELCSSDQWPRNEDLDKAKAALTKATR